MRAVTKRRAVVRWAWRMFRREWRQQLLIVLLLTVAVAAAVGSITLVYNTAPADDAKFGSASHLLRFDGTDPRKLAAGLAAAKRSFGAIDVIAHDYASVPGGVERVYYRALDPEGAYVGDSLALRTGNYPTESGQAAVTDGVADLMQLELGSTLALDGRRRKVVGIVENPRQLSDEFALVSPASIDSPHYVTVLVDTNTETLRSFVEALTERSAFSGSESRANQQAADALAMLSIATVFLLLAALVAAAAFTVVAQRRLRQLGMLAAVGATHKQVRTVLLANGAFVGVIAALVGTAVGLGVWNVAAPMLESAVDHRIDRFSLPWGLIALAILLALVAATLAAWWPGRSAARLPVVLALSGRPPKPRPARHATIAAVASIVGGIACLAFSDRETKLLVVIGIVATILGTLLLAPLAIRLFSGVARRVSIAPRLALRDLVRYQARSGAALAAVTLALGIAAAIAIVGSAEAAKRNAEPPNLSDRQIRIHLGPNEDREATPVDALDRIDAVSAGVRRLAAQLDHATVIPLRKALQRNAPRAVVDDTVVLVTPELARQRGRQFYTVESWLFVATPAVLRYLGIDPATIDPRTDFLAYPSVPVDELVVPTAAGRWTKARVARVQQIETGRRFFGSFDFGFNEVLAFVPPTFITLDGLRRRGWTQIPSTWLVESSRPLTSSQVAAARRVAADAGFTIELRRDKTSFARPMAITTGAGALLALAILAMTVGLIRGEGAGDLRTLTATGASGRVRRTLTATTAGALALVGALLGVAGAYVVLTAMYHDDLGYLSDVPVASLGLAVLGVPLAATAAGWLLAGREPPALARAAIE